MNSPRFDNHFFLFFRLVFVCVFFLSPVLKPHPHPHPVFVVVAQIRKTMISCILATDMSQHFQMVSKLDQLFEKMEVITWVVREKASGSE
jgi:hypothetical protein